VSWRCVRACDAKRNDTEAMCVRGNACVCAGDVCVSVCAKRDIDDTQLRVRERGSMSDVECASILILREAILLFTKSDVRCAVKRRTKRNT
jgi:hypothetical protein